MKKEILANQTEHLNSINVTVDFGIFNQYAENRQVKESHLVKIMESIKNNGYLPSFPILVDNNTMTVIDGHHRLEACKRLGKSVYFVKIDADREIGKYIYDISRTNKKWSNSDWLSFWANRGKASYLEILSFIEENEIKNAEPVICLTQNTSSIGTIRKIIMDGDLEIVNKKYVDIYYDILKIGKNNPAFMKNKNIYAIIKCLTIDGFSLKVLYSQMLKYGGMWLPSPSMHGSVEQIERVYNYRKRSKVNFKY